MESFNVLLVVMLAIGTALGELTPTQQGEVDDIENGNYEDPQNEIFSQVNNDIKELYSKAAQLIQELQQSGQAVEEEQESIQYLKSLESKIGQLSATTEWGKMYVQFLGNMVEKIKFILEQNLKVAQDQKFIDWSNQDLLKVFSDIIAAGKNVMHSDLLSNPDKLKQNIEEVKDLGQQFLDLVNSSAPSDQIIDIFRNGVELLVAKVNAFMNFNEKSLQK